MGKRAEIQEANAIANSDVQMQKEFALQHKKNHPYVDFLHLSDKQLLDIAYGIRTSASRVCKGTSRYSEYESVGRTDTEIRQTVPKGLSKRIRHLKAEMRRRHMETEVGKIFGDWLRKVCKTH